jgi:hypothetical protein
VVGERTGEINNMKNFIEGKKYISLCASSGFYKEGEILTCTQSHTAGVLIAITSFSKYDADRKWCDGKNFVEYVEDPVEIAKANLAKAQEALDAAVEAERKSKVFTEADLKVALVVRNKDTNQIRLVIVNGSANSAVSLDQTGLQVNSYSGRYTSRTLVEWLNSWYEKTTLTLKDFANA